MNEWRRTLRVGEPDVVPEGQTEGNRFLTHGEPDVVCRKSKCKRLLLPILNHQDCVTSR